MVTNKSSKTKSALTGREIDRSVPIPRYFQLAEMLKEQIDSGQLAPGDQIPSERELSEQFGVSRVTVRQAIKYLVSQGRLVVRLGSGTFVGEPKLTHDTLHLLGFTEQMQLKGQAAASRVLEQSVVEPPASVAARLELAPGSQTTKIVRLRFSHETPMLLETVYISHALAPSLEREDLSSESLYSILEQRYGLSLLRAHQTLEITRASAEEALLFGVARGEAMFLLEGVTYTDHEQPVEVFKALYHGQMVRFELESQRLRWVTDSADAPHLSLVMR